MHSDCSVRRCPIYKKMPYRKRQPDYSWIFDKFTSTHSSRIDMDPMVLNHKPTGKTVEEKTESIIIARTTAEQQYIREHRKNNAWPSITSMFRAKCYSCCGDFSDRPVDVIEEEKGGKGWDCQIRNCPIYYWMPYRVTTPLYDWILDLECNQKHENAMVLNCMSRAEYLEWFLNGRKGNSEVEEEDEDTEEQTISV